MKILQTLGKYRVKNHFDQEREWLYGVDLITIKNEIHKCSEFLNERRDTYEKDEDDIRIKDENKIEEEKNIEEEEETKEEEYIETSNNKYDIDISKLEIKRNNPDDIKQFISDCCEIKDDYYVIQTDIRCAFKIWGKTYTKDVEIQFTKYMKENYKNTNMIIDNQKRHVYKGIKLKELTYKKTVYNFDFENFIETKCKVNFLNRISYHDFFHFFTIWKKDMGDVDFKLNNNDKIKLQEILELTFAKGRVLHSTIGKSKNLYGIFGIGLLENNFGLIEKKRQNKKVGEYHVDTNELNKEYDSIYLCANILKIPLSTFSGYIRNKTICNGKYYKLIIIKN